MLYIQNVRKSLPAGSTQWEWGIKHVQAKESAFFPLSLMFYEEIKICLLLPIGKCISISPLFYEYLLSWIPSAANPYFMNMRTHTQKLHRNCFPYDIKELFLLVSIYYFDQGEEMSPVTSPKYISESWEVFKTISKLWIIFLFVFMLYLLRQKRRDFFLLFSSFIMPLPMLSLVNSNTFHKDNLIIFRTISSQKPQWLRIKMLTFSPPHHVIFLYQLFSFARVQGKASEAFSAHIGENNSIYVFQKPFLRIFQFHLFQIALPQE